MKETKYIFDNLILIICKALTRKRIFNTKQNSSPHTGCEGRY